MIKLVDVSRFRENVMHAIDCLEMSVSIKSRSLPVAVSRKDFSKHDTQ